MSDVLLESVQDGHWTLVLNRPEKRNALNAELVEALIDAVQRAQVSGAHSLTLRGEGKCFCAGFDFTGFDESSEADLLWRFVRIEQLLEMVYASPMSTLAFAHGKNFGAGVDLLVSCQKRIATEDSTFRMPGLKFGLVLGTRRLACRIGNEAARSIQEVAATLQAKQALAVGLLTGIASMQELDQVVEQLRQSSTSLEPEVRSMLYQVVTDRDADRDLAQLVRSVMRPGLKQRIARYRAGECTHEAVVIIRA